mgnify:CR=1 FL=1
MTETIIQWLNQNEGLATWIASILTSVGLILTRTSFRNKILVEASSNGRRIDNRKFIKVNYFISVTNVGVKPVLPVEVGYIGRRKLQKVYMPLISDDVDDIIEPYKKMVRGSQVALIEDILEFYGFVKADNDIKVRAYVKMKNGKVYTSKKTVVFNLNTLYKDGEKVSEMNANNTITDDDLFPKE